MKKRIFLGGTCNASTWRDELIQHLNPAKYEWFNPVVEDWTPACIQEEIAEKELKCNLHLYVITPEMVGFYSIAEAVESAITSYYSEMSKVNTVFVLFEGGSTFSESQRRSLNAVGDTVARYEGYYLVTKSMEDLADFLNNYLGKPNV